MSRGEENECVIFKPIHLMGMTSVVIGTSDLFHKQLVVQQHKKFAEICCIQ